MNLSIHKKYIFTPGIALYKVQVNKNRFANHNENGKIQKLKINKYIMHVTKIHRNIINNLKNYKRRKNKKFMKQMVLSKHGHKYLIHK